MEPGWYSIVVTPDDGTHIYRLGDGYDAEAFGPLLDRVRAAHAVPDGWVNLGAGWDLSITEGPIHPKRLAAADVTVHDHIPGPA